jgi:HEAT repeat protein
MGRIGDPSCTGALIRCLQDPSTMIRIGGCEVLGKLRAREAVPALEFLLSDPFSDVRESAGQALSRICGKRE